jgi:hypothetical protein
VARHLKNYGKTSFELNRVQLIGCDFAIMGGDYIGGVQCLQDVTSYLPLRQAAHPENPPLYADHAGQPLLGCR